MYAQGKFPKLSNLACKSKWSWTTLKFFYGSTTSCHRCTNEPIDVNNFDNFHNTPGKLQQRELMLQDIWPGNGCEFCRDVEEVGGTSDRMFQNSIPTFPIELENNNITTITTPTTVEVYLDNKCNLACVYCHAGFSSRIANENKKFGKFEVPGLFRNEFMQRDSNYDQNIASFWKWLEKHSDSVEHLNILGGEPFFQDDFDVCIEFFRNNPSPNLTLTIVSNLVINADRFKAYINLLKTLVSDKKLKGIDITASIDCWGEQQEFVRYGMKLATFEKNMEYLLSQDEWLRVNVNQTITSLTIHTMPELIKKVNEWRRQKDVGHYGGLAVFCDHLSPRIFGNPNIWKLKLDEVMSLLKTSTFNEKNTFNLFEGVQKLLNDSTDINQLEVENFYVYMNEIDKRRGTNWKSLFPHLTKESISNVV